MFKHLSELIVRVFDLVEAEGRVLRAVLAQIGLGLALTLGGAMLALVGVGLLLAALWIGVSHQIGPAWASLVTGVVVLVLAGGTLVCGGRMLK